MMRMREMLFLELSTAELMKMAFPDSGPSRIGPEEAKKLDDLGVKLRDTQRSPDPNRSGAAGAKIQRDVSGKGAKAKKD
jgi:hypothetical protein